MKELVLKKCASCGALVKVIKDCHCACGIQCCDEEMGEVLANSSDGAKEKHVPVYKKMDNELEVTVPHVMDDDHYIEWIMLVNDETEEIRYLNPKMEAKVIFPYTEGTLYTYCNKHGLWSKKIEN